MNETFMKEKPVLPLLLSMALPNVVSMLVNSLYNIVDSLFVARISEDAMTALSLEYPIQNFANAIAIGFTVVVCWNLHQQVIITRFKTLNVRFHRRFGISVLLHARFRRTAVLVKVGTPLLHILQERLCGSVLAILHAITKPCKQIL